MKTSLPMHLELQQEGLRGARRQRLRMSSQLHKRQVRLLLQHNRQEMCQKQGLRRNPSSAEVQEPPSRGLRSLIEVRMLQLV